MYSDSLTLIKFSNPNGYREYTAGYNRRVITVAKNSYEKELQILW